MKSLKLFALVLAAAVFSALGAATAVAQDPLKVAPEMYKIVYENDRVRVMEVTFAPGSKIDKHSHPDHFAYVLTAGKLRIFKPNAEPAEADLTVGQVLWIPGETHWAENAGETEIRALITELKEPAPKAKAKTKTTKKTT
jgi:quercetin dioxygenase-like cupin family protein